MGKRMKDTKVVTGRDDRGSFTVWLEWSDDEGTIQQVVLGRHVARPSAFKMAKFRYEKIGKQLAQAELDEIWPEKG